MEYYASMKKKGEALCELRGENVHIVQLKKIICPKLCLESDDFIFIK